MNRVRDFLARMEEKTAFRACVFAAILVLMAATMFLLNTHTPLQMDDYDYSFSWSTGKPLAGVADVLASQAAHYRLWGGRSVVHTLAQLFLYWGKGVFNIANTAAYMLLVLELYMLAKPKGRRFCWTILLVIHAALFTLVPFFGTVFLWLDGACNYLWGTALALLPLLIIPRLLEKECAALGVIGVPLCFLSGWTNENAACGMLAVALLLLADSAYRGKRTPVSAWLCLAAQAAGAAMMILAPGNFARASVYAYDSMAWEIVKRLLRITLYTGVYAGAELLAMPIVHGMGRALHVPMRNRRAALLLLAALLSAYAMVASPELSDRSYTCVIALTLCALATLLGDMEAHVRALDAARLCALPLALFLLVYGGYQAVREVGAHEAAWKAQTQKIETAVQSGADEVKIASVESRSRFTMNIALENDAESWPNSTLSKWFGIRVYGE